MPLEQNGNGKEFGISKYLQHVFVYISTWQLLHYD